MNAFLQRHAGSVIGCLSGFDRLLFRGTLRLIAHAAGMMRYLWARQVLLKDFGDWSQSVTRQVRSASEGVARDAGRPVVYLSDPSAGKEDLARSIARRDGVAAGLVCVLTAVEPCRSFDVRRDRAGKRLELVSRYRKCLHLYHYSVDPVVGLMHVRVQTWLPLGLRVCLNGREWLARQMDAAGVGYERRDNCFTRVSDPAAAQRLLDGQLAADWAGLLGRVAAAASPAHAALFGPASAVPVDPYWSADQTEFATDVMFRSPAALAGVYPRLVRHGVTALSCPDVMRFLGRKVPAHGGVNGHFAGEVVTDLRARPEGVRLKHRAGGNSVKMYDKQGSVLRVETTVNDPGDFKVYRGTEADPGNKGWRALRKGVADVHRRAEVSRAANDRYLAALAAADTGARVGQAVRPLTRAVTRAGRRFRGLRPLADDDARLLAAVGRGEFAVNGFRNADVRHALFGPDGPDKARARRRSGQVTRKLAMLHAHGLIKKVPRTRRWLLTDKGRDATTLLAAANNASAKQLLDAA